MTERPISDFAGLASRSASPYLEPMWFPRPASPRTLVADLRAFTAGRTRVQWFAATMAVLMPLTIIVLFLLDGRQNIRPGPELIMVKSWPASRTDAEIKADQVRNQARREAALRERQRQWQKVDKRLEKVGI